MASSREYADFIRARFERLGNVLTVRPMMGGFVIHFAGKVLGFITDDRLVLEPGPTIARLLPESEQIELFPGSKLFYVIDDSMSPYRLCEIAQAIYDDLPVSKPRKSRKSENVSTQAENRFGFAKHINW